MGHYDCKYCDASPGEEHSADCERFQPMTNPKHTDTSRIADLRFQVSEKMPINHSDLSCLFDRIEALEAENERLREELAAAYVDQSGTVQHASDCATSNAPAMKPGPCDCAALGEKQ